MSDTSLPSDHWRRFFDREAWKFGSEPSANGHYNNRSFEITRKAVFEALAGTDKKVLDVGCGNGAMLKPLVDRHEISGVDFSHAMCLLAHRAGYRNVIQSKSEHLGFESSSFDFVLSSGVIQLLSSEVLTLEEMVRVAKPGGSIIVVTVNSESLLRKVVREKHYSREFRVDQLASQFLSLGLARVRIAPLFIPFGVGRSTPEASFFGRLAMVSFLICGTKPPVPSL